MTQFKRIEDRMWVGPQPTAEDLDAARAQGVKTVIDLRLPQETAGSNRALVGSHGLTYRNIPVDKEHLLESQVDEFASALQASDGPVLAHCATGARAALLLALDRARRNGWSSAQAFDWARSIGFDLESSPAFATFVRDTLRPRT